MTKKKFEYTEKQTLQIIQKISERISKYFTLGYLTAEDIQQECFILGWTALSIYNGEHPLEHFLYVRIRSRFLNLIRKKVRRKDPPCYTCHAAHLEPDIYKPDHPENQFCKKYLMWLERNNTKSMLIHTFPVNEFDIEQQGRDLEICPTFKQEVIDLLKKEVPETQQLNLTNFLNGKKLREKTLLPFLQVCREIIEKHNIKWEELNGFRNK